MGIDRRTLFKAGGVVAAVSALPAVAPRGRGRGSGGISAHHPQPGRQGRAGGAAVAV